RDPELRRVGDALDDVLEGRRYWSEDMRVSGRGSGWLREQPQVPAWARNAFERAAARAGAGPQDLLDALQLHAAAASEGFEAWNLGAGPAESPLHRDARTRPHFEAAARHTEHADMLVGRWTARTVAEFVGAAPGMLETIVREEGLEAELGT